MVMGHASVCCYGRPGAGTCIGSLGVALDRCSRTPKKARSRRRRGFGPSLVHRRSSPGAVHTFKLMVNIAC